MNTKDRRQAALQALIDEDKGPDRGKKARCAERIRKSPAQVSQWLSGYRTIEDETAREIEQAAGKPKWWMDGGAAPATARQVTLADALDVLGQHLARKMDRETREELGEALSTWARWGGKESYRNTVATLLLGAPGKQQNAA